MYSLSGARRSHCCVNILDGPIRRNRTRFDTFINGRLTFCKGLNKVLCFIVLFDWILQEHTEYFIWNKMWKSIVWWLVIVFSLFPSISKSNVSYKNKNMSKCFLIRCLRFRYQLSLFGMSSCNLHCSATGSASLQTTTCRRFTTTPTRWWSAAV